MPSGCRRPRRRLTLGVKEHLPGFRHVADRFHIRQHLHATAEALYGKEHPGARKWSATMARRLTEQGGAKLADRLRRLALCYTDLTHQRAVLDRARFLDRHGQKINYPEMIKAGLPVGSGAIESLCKQLVTRLKSSGKRWNTTNVTPMALLTC